jgi:hypothetical protein
VHTVHHALTHVRGARLTTRAYVEHGPRRGKSAAHRNAARRMRRGVLCPAILGSATGDPVGPLGRPPRAGDLWRQWAVRRPRVRPDRGLETSGPAIAPCTGRSFLRPLSWVPQFGTPQFLKGGRVARRSIPDPLGSRCPPGRLSHRRWGSAARTPADHDRRLPTRRLQAARGVRRDRGQVERRSCASKHDDDRERALAASVDAMAQHARLGCWTIVLPRDKRSA